MRRLMIVFDRWSWLTFLGLVIWSSFTGNIPIVAITGFATGWRLYRWMLWLGTWERER